MTAKAYQEYSSSRLTVVSREYPVSKVQGATLSEVCVHAAIGTIFGIVAGLAVAVTASSMINPTGSQGAGLASFSATQLTETPVVKAAENSPTHVVASTQDHASLSTVTSPAVSALPAQTPLIARVKQAVLKAPSARHSLLIAKVATKNDTEVSSDLTATAVQPPAPAVLPQENAAASASFMVEGDATVAEFDAAAGTIQTQEGKTFLMGVQIRDVSAVQWQDDLGNVHYKCDSQGNCTLSHAGVVISNARLALATDSPPVSSDLQSNRT